MVDRQRPARPNHIVYADDALSVEQLEMYQSKVLEDVPSHLLLPTTTGPGQLRCLLEALKQLKQNLPITLAILRDLPNVALSDATAVLAGLQRRNIINAEGKACAVAIFQDPKVTFQLLYCDKEGGKKQPIMFNWEQGIAHKNPEGVPLSEENQRALKSFVVDFYQPGYALTDKDTQFFHFADMDPEPKNRQPLAIADENKDGDVALAILKIWRHKTLSQPITNEDVKPEIISRKLIVESLNELAKPVLAANAELDEREKKYNFEFVGHKKAHALENWQADVATLQQALQQLIQFSGHADFAQFLRYYQINAVIADQDRKLSYQFDDGSKVETSPCERNITNYSVTARSAEEAVRKIAKVAFLNCFNEAVKNAQTNKTPIGNINPATFEAHIIYSNSGLTEQQIMQIFTEEGFGEGCVKLMALDQNSELLDVGAEREIAQAVERIEKASQQAKQAVSDMHSAAKKVEQAKQLIIDISDYDNPTIDEPMSKLDKIKLEMDQALECAETAVEEIKKVEETVKKLKDGGAPTHAKAQEACELADKAASAADDANDKAVAATRNATEVEALAEELQQAHPKAEMDGVYAKNEEVDTDLYTIAEGMTERNAPKSAASRASIDVDSVKGEVSNFNNLPTDENCEDEDKESTDYDTTSDDEAATEETTSLLGDNLNSSDTSVEEQAGLITNPARAAAQQNEDFFGSIRAKVSAGINGLLHRQHVKDDGQASKWQTLASREKELDSVPQLVELEELSSQKNINKTVSAQEKSNWAPDSQAIAPISEPANVSAGFTADPASEFHKHQGKQTNLNWTTRKPGGASQQKQAKVGADKLIIELNVKLKEVKNYDAEKLSQLKNALEKVGREIALLPDGSRGILENKIKILATAIEARYEVLSSGTQRPSLP